MIEKIRNLIKAAVNLGTDDSGRFRRGKSRWYGRRGQKVQSFVPFGTFGNPGKGNEQVIFSPRCEESSQVAMEGDSINRIRKNTKPGEYGTGNPRTKANTYYREDGAIELQTEKTTVEFFPNGTIKITGLDDVELIDVIDQWMGVMIGAKVITGIGLQPFDPTTITAMQAVRTDLQKLKT